MLRNLMLCLFFSLVIAHAQAAQATTLSAEEAVALYEPTTSYTIYRKGKPIGRHTLEFQTNDSEISVMINTDILIKVLGITFFEYHYDSLEKWKNNQLVSVKSSSKTKKKSTNTTLLNNETQSVMKGGEGETRSPRIDVATNHWYMKAVSQTSLFNTLKGIKSDITVTRVGNEMLTISNKEVETTHYKFDGGFIAQSWYDQSGRWVKLAFLGDDGSNVTIVIDEL